MSQIVGTYPLFDVPKGRKVVRAYSDPLLQLHLSSSEGEKIVVGGEGESSLLKELLEIASASPLYFLDDVFAGLALRYAACGIVCPDWLRSHKTSVSLFSLPKSCLLPKSFDPLPCLTSLFHQPEPHVLANIAFQSAVCARLSDDTDVPTALLPPDPDITDVPPFFHPRINTARLKQDAGDISFFFWITKPLDGLLNHGPSDAGWKGDALGKIQDGRFRPDYMRVRGFCGFHQGVAISYLHPSENNCLEAGISWLEDKIFTSRIFVESPSQWRLFTLLRAVASGTPLSDSFFGAKSRKFLSSTDDALPRGNQEFQVALFRHCIERGAITSTAGRLTLNAPLFCGQDSIALESEGYCYSVASFLSSSPYLVQLPCLGV